MGYVVFNQIKLFQVKIKIEIKSDDETDMEATIMAPNEILTVSNLFSNFTK
jgi:hypothetical protein